MAGHSKFKNIMHRKGAQDKKRAKVFTKAMREIFVAAKSGPDPSMNSRLRHAISDAKNVNLPKDKIDAAIKRATSKSESDNYHELRYEGYGPCGIPFIIEAISDNKHRTGGDVRAAFNKYGGTLGEQNSVHFMFKHFGQFIYENQAHAYDDFLNTSIELELDECNVHENDVELLCEPSDFHRIKESLLQKYEIIPTSTILWLPQNPVSLTDDEKDKVTKFINALDALDDVQNIYGNFVSYHDEEEE